MTAPWHLTPEERIATRRDIHDRHRRAMQQITGPSRYAHRLPDMLAASHEREEREVEAIRAATLDGEPISAAEAAVHRGLGRAA